MKDYDLLEVMPLMVFVHDATHVHFMNATARRALKYGSLEEVIGLPLSDFVHPDSHEVALERRLLMLERAHTLKGIDVKLVATDGSIVYLRADGATVEHGSGRLIIAVGNIVPRGTTAQRQH